MGGEIRDLLKVKIIQIEHKNPWSLQSLVTHFFFLLFSSLHPLYATCVLWWAINILSVHPS